MRQKRGVRVAATLTVTGACLAYIVWQIDIGQTVEILRDADYWYLAAAVLIMTVTVLPMAWRWQRLLDKGTYSSVTEIAEAEKISKSYVSRILRLTLLAPDIVEAILGGWADQRVMLKKLERPLPMVWEEQRAHLGS